MEKFTKKLCGFSPGTVAVAHYGMQEWDFFDVHPFAVVLVLSLVNFLLGHGDVKILAQCSYAASQCRIRLCNSVSVSEADMVAMAAFRYHLFASWKQRFGYRVVCMQSGSLYSLADPHAIRSCVTTACTMTSSRAREER